MERLPTDKDTFPGLIRTLTRNVICKKEKHGLCDRFRVAKFDCRSREARYAQSCTANRLEMCQRQKNDDNSRQSGTLVTIYVDREPIGSRVAVRCRLTRSEVGLAQGIGLIRK
jgi:hypothetical protein